jgi:hypothetical protein
MALRMKKHAPTWRSVLTTEGRITFENLVIIIPATNIPYLRHGFENEKTRAVTFDNPVIIITYQHTIPTEWIYQIHYNGTA